MRNWPSKSTPVDRGRRLTLVLQRRSLRPRGRIAAILLPLATAACHGGAPAPGVARRDSAGVTISESHRPQWSGKGGGWRLDTVPSLDLGAPPGGPTHEFYRIDDVARLADGSFAVANRGSSEVQFFSKDGTYLGAFGRHGEGPGEFDRLRSVARYRGDSLVAFDFWLRRATIIGPDRKLGRVVTFLNVPVIYDLQPLPDGSFALITTDHGPLDTGRGRVRMPQPVVRFGVDGALLDTLFIAAGAETFVFAEGDGRPPLAKRSIVRVHEGQLYYGAADELQYEIRDGMGVLRRIVRVPDYPLAFAGTRRAALQATRDTVHVPPPLQPVFNAMAIPDSVPAYEDLRVDPVGCVWLAEYHTGNEIDLPTKWEIFSAQGEWLGSLSMPSRFEVMRVGLDYVVGVRRDELDVETVQVLDLDRSGSG